MSSHPHAAHFPHANTPAERAHVALRVLGAPLRLPAIGLVKLYRVTVGQAVGGRCRYYPSCSAYAEEVLDDRGFVVGVLLTGWRLLRCNPFSAGGMDRVPRRGVTRLYDYITRRTSLEEIRS